MTPRTSNDETHACRPMLLASLFALLSSLPLASSGATQPSVEILDHAIETGSVVVRAREHEAPRALEAESALVELAFASGQRYRAQILSIHDPDSGLSWWTLQETDGGEPTDRISAFRSRYAFYASPSEIVGILLLAPPPSAWLRRSTARASSHEEIRQRAVSTLLETPQALEHRNLKLLRQVSLWDALPIDLYYRPNDANPRFELVVGEIDRLRGEGWELILIGRQGRRARVILDEFFNLVSATELTDNGGSAAER